MTVAQLSAQALPNAPKVMSPGRAGAAWGPRCGRRSSTGCSAVDREGAPRWCGSQFRGNVEPAKCTTLVVLARKAPGELNLLERLDFRRGRGATTAYRLAGEPQQLRFDLDVQTFR